MKKFTYIFLTAFVFLTLMAPISFSQTNQKTIHLLPPNLKSGKLLMQSLNERKSSRSFTKKAIPINILSDLLWAASGINRPESGLRTAPSAVNWQEINIYVALERGLYLYNAKKNLLYPVLEKDIRAFVGKQDFTKIAPVSLIYVADLSKMSGEIQNDNFYSATDTGFISQNVYLYCASAGLGTVVLGWIDKPALSKEMGLSENMKIILTQPVGFPE